MKGATTVICPHVAVGRERHRPMLNCQWPMRLIGYTWRSGSGGSLSRSPRMDTKHFRNTSRVARVWPLAAILLVHWILALGFNAMTPIFEGPDEPNHFL